MLWTTLWANPWLAPLATAKTVVAPLPRNAAVPMDKLQFMLQRSPFFGVARPSQTTEPCILAPSCAKGPVATSDGVEFFLLGGEAPGACGGSPAVGIGAGAARSAVAGLGSSPSSTAVLLTPSAASTSATASAAATGAWSSLTERAASTEPRMERELRAIMIFLSAFVGVGK